MWLSKTDRYCEFYDGCKYRRNPLTAHDQPNLIAHLGLRVVLTTLSWLVLALNVGDGLFVGIFLFVFPLFIDCLKLTPLTPIRQKIRCAELIVSGLWCIFAVMGLFGILQINVSTMTISTSEAFIGFSLKDIPIQNIWQWLGSAVLLSVVDWMLPDCGMNDFKRRG